MTDAASQITQAGPALAVSALNVHVRPHGPAPAAQLLHDVALRVDRGESVGLVGESGSGKTMTLRAVLRMLPPGVAVSGGAIDVAGQDLTRLPPRQVLRARRELIGYVPQDPLAALNPCLPVGEQITESRRLASGRRLRGVTEILRGYGVRLQRRRWNAEAAELLASVSISDPQRRVHDFPHQFSGGMRQRALIAGATALRPAVILADEPTTALDASVERTVLDLLREEMVGTGSGLLLVTHDLGVVSWYCDRTYVMFRGHILETAPTAELFSRPRHPYTHQLMAAARRDVPAARRPTGLPDVPVTAGGCPFLARCPRRVAECAEQVPALTAQGPDHLVRCVNPVGEE